MCVVWINIIAYSVYSGWCGSTAAGGEMAGTGPIVGIVCSVRWLGQAFTKPPLLQKSRLTRGGSPIGCVLVEWKVPVECRLGAAINSHSFHP